QLVDRALRTRDAQDAQLGQIARERSLGRVDAFAPQRLRQLLLRGDPLHAQRAPDRVLPRILGEFQPHAEIQLPTPLSVKSSPMIECGTRPSSRCTLGTPLASTLRMLRALAIIPPEIVPSAMSASTSLAVSWPINSPPFMMPGTSDR